MAEATNHNEAGEVAPSTVDQQAPTVSEQQALSTDSPQATDIPSANAPDPTTANSDVNPNAAGEKPTTEGEKSETTEQTSAKKPAAKSPTEKPTGDAAAKAPKKEKAPAVEDKPFAEFIEQDFLPALKTSLESKGVQNLDLNFAKQKIPILGFDQSSDCWQITGTWQAGKRNFNLYFPEEDIQGKKFFSCNEGNKPSTLEPFLCDERKISLDLMLFGMMQRLNGQKWLARN